jgi:hypothetical protein
MSVEMIERFKKDMDMKYHVPLRGRVKRRFEEFPGDSRGALAGDGFEGQFEIASSSRNLYLRR